MRMMSEYLPGEGSTSTETVRKSFIEQYFGGENTTTLKCSESEEEPEAKSIEKWTQLRCHINTDVRYMQLGLTMVCAFSLSAYVSVSSFVSMGHGSGNGHEDRSAHVSNKC